ncbi:MAG: glycosyltransferase family 61 protein [Pseudomonadota bacterium]
MHSRVMVPRALPTMLETLGPGKFAVKRLMPLVRQLKLKPGTTRPSVETVLSAAQASKRHQWLHDWQVGDFAVEERELLAEGANPLVNHPSNRFFHGTDVNCVALGFSHQYALKLLRYDDVQLAATGSNFAIFRDRVIDKRSTGVVLDTRPTLMRRAPVAMDVGAYCDDSYRPSNPCHFMVDRLPRMFVYQTMLGLPQAACITVDAVSPYCAFALKQFAPAATVLAPNRVYHFRKLYVLSTCIKPRGHPFFYMRPEFIDAVVPKITADLPPPSADRLIYMSRFASNRRKLLNEADVAGQLEARGFEILEMSHMTPAEQLEAVRAARVVVAPHGAALANILGATPTTRIIELINPEKATAAYAALSAVVGAPYEPVFGTPADDPELQDAWRIDVEAVMGALDRPPPVA